jgi:hypothetical protein
LSADLKLGPRGWVYGRVDAGLIVAVFYVLKAVCIKVEWGFVD